VIIEKFKSLDETKKQMLIELLNQWSGLLRLTKIMILWTLL
jgi:hypothetical protein